MANKNKRSFGSFGEQIAVKFLQKNGYIILEKNFRVGRIGEVDIIAKDSEYICFIEVKTRSSTIYGTPSEAVTKSKQKKITALANIYLSQHNSMNQNVRFDVIEILFDKNTSESNKYHINNIKNAF